MIIPTSSEHKNVQARILAYAETISWTIVSREEAEGALLGQFRHLHIDVNKFPAWAIERKNAAKDEAIALGVGGNPVPRQGVVDFDDGVVDEKWRQAVAKLAGTFLEQDFPESVLQVPRYVWQPHNFITA